MTPVVIALGSNVGDSAAYLRDALALLRGQMTVLRVSPAYRTAPMYVEDQPPFLNAALTGETDLGPRGVLRMLKGIEAEVGREKRQRFGPREIDLDLIAFGSLAYSFTDGEAILQVPHPRLGERRFVLVPLAEIAPELRIPGMGTVREMVDQTNRVPGAVEEVTHAEL